MQSPKEVIMVRPKAFGYDPETAVSNVFQNKPLDNEEMNYQDMALSEFDNAVSSLRSNGIKVTIFNEDDTDEVKKPDSIFPNNWFSTHSNGIIILYPMMAKSRRLEKRFDIIKYLQDNFKFKEIIDISNFAEDDMFLEGTGSIVFDHENKKLGYSLAEFDAVDGDGIPIYHTNVMMWIGTEVAAICSKSIKDSEERKKILGLLSNSKREIIDLSFPEVLGFAGNCLELVGRNETGSEELILALSAKALQSLEDRNLEKLKDYLKLVSIDVGTIEHIGGGGIRCMLAGVHMLPIT